LVQIVYEQTLDMKTYMRFCMYLEHNSINSYRSENVLNKYSPEK
jgi:hypothetical protein